MIEKEVTHDQFESQKQSNVPSVHAGLSEPSVQRLSHAPKNQHELQTSFDPNLNPEWQELWEEFGMTQEQREALAAVVDEEMERRSRTDSPVE